MFETELQSTETIELLNGTTINFLLIKKYRRSIGLKITKDGLIVHAPILMTKSSIKKAIISKQKWIESKLDLINVSPITFSISSLQTFNLLGKAMTLQCSTGPKKIFVKGDECFLSFNDLNNQEKLKKYFVKWLKDYALDYFKARVYLHSKNNNLIVNNVLLSNAKTKWGTCNYKRKVRLNWRLIQASTFIIDYVICHELSHLKFMNHSKQFWDLVEDIFPDYKEAQKQLKLIGFHLYQLD